MPRPNGQERARIRAERRRQQAAKAAAAKPKKMASFREDPVANRVHQIQNGASAAALAKSGPIPSPAEQARTTSTGSNASTNTQPPATRSPALNPTVDKADPGKAYLKGLGSVLKYPQNLLEGNDDYLKIDICEYEPALAETQGGGKALTTFLTYMPRNIGSSYSQNWGSATLSPNGRIAINAVQQALNKTPASSVGGYLQSALKGTGTTFAAGQIAAGIQNLAQGTQGLDANSLLGLTTGVGINSTVEIYWGGHGDNRNFSFRIEMSPRNEPETIQIREIVKAFKVAMHPGSNGASAGSSVQSRFVTYPYMMKLQYMHGSKPHEFLHQFKPCVLTGMDVQYTPNGTYSTLPNTSPTSTVMTLTFKEIRMIYREDILDSTGAGF